METKKNLQEHQLKVLKDINNTIANLKKNKSLSSYYYSLIDLDALYELCSILDINNYPIYDDINKVDIDKNRKSIGPYILKNLFLNLDIYEKMCNNVINELNTFSLYYNPINHPISIEDNYTYSAEFLNYFSKSFLNILLKLLLDNRIIIVNDFEDSPKASGFTYTSYSNFDPYILLLDCGNIVTGSSLVHEIAHAYNDTIVNNVNRKDKQFIRYSFTDELTSLYTEIIFSNYLSDNHLLNGDGKSLLRNMTFNFYLATKAVLDTIKTLKNNGEIVFTDEIRYDFEVLIAMAIGLYLAQNIKKDEALKKIDIINKNGYKIDFIDTLIQAELDIDDIISFNSASKYIRKKLI